MITLGDKNYQFFLSSGMMGFDGRGATIAHRILYDLLKLLNLYDPNLFAIVTKTITRYPRKGPKKIRPIKNGWWNNFGLDNTGLLQFISKYQKKIYKDKNLILSIAGKEKEQLRVMLIELESRLPNILAFEYNASCPNDIIIGEEETIRNCETIRSLVNTPLIVKVGHANSHYMKIAKKTEGLVQAISINSVPALIGGARSGKTAQEINWRILKELADTVSTPIIAPSIWEYEDIGKTLAMGARAISFGSVSMIHPKRPWGPVLPTLWARRYSKEQNRKDWEMKACARSNARSK
ncbi:MAG: hypothetical protein WC587_00370 [Candidatus Paceibacterota bacterium]